MLFYLVCVFSVFTGFFISNYFPNLKFQDKKHKDKAISDYITFFFFNLKTTKFLSIIIKFYFICVVLKFIIISTTGIGLTGATHTADQSLLHWLSSRSAVIGGYAFFSVLLLNELDKKTKLKKIFFIFYFLENLLMASRSFFLSIIQYITVSYYFLKKAIKPIYILLALTLLITSSAFYYTLITVLRNYLLSGELYISDDTILFSISRGFSQLEPLFLWIDMPSNLYQESIGLFSDFKLFINSFAIGDLIPDPNRVNLGKLMVQYGRQGDFDIFALAGHSENPGAFATTYIYLGIYGGMVYIWCMVYI
jgi:hypothetical protein